MLLRRRHTKNPKPATEPAAPDEGTDPEVADYSTWRKAQLVDEAERRGLPKRGTVAELAERLTEHDATLAEPDADEDTGEDDEPTEDDEREGTEDDEPTEEDKA